MSEDFPRANTQTATIDILKNAVEKKEDGSRIDHLVSSNMRKLVPPHTQVDEQIRQLGRAEYDKKVERDEAERIRNHKY
jgi:hypothetical protein